MRPGQQPVRVDLDPLADPDVEGGRQGPEVLAVADHPVAAPDRRDVQARAAADEPAADDDVRLHLVGHVERRQLGQVDRRGDPDDPVDVVLIGAVDRHLVAPIAAGPDPVVGDEVTDAEGQAERHQVRDQVVDATDLGEDVQGRQPDDLGDEVEQVERQVAPQEMAADLPATEHPQLDEDEVRQGRDLGRQERRPEELLFAHRGHERVQRDLVDEDPGDADERELARAEEGSEEATDPRPAVPACGALGVRLGLRHRSLGTDGRRPHRNRAPNGASNRGRTETPEGTNRSAGPFPPMQAPATRFRRTPVRSRRRRCKHLRRRFRSVMAPSGKTNDTGGQVVLAMGLSTNFAAGTAIPSALSTVRPRTRPRPVLATASAQRSSGQRTSPGRTRIPARSSSPGGGHGNARRNRRSSTESPRASSSGLKASVHRPLRARPTMTAARHRWLPAYPRPSRFQAAIPGGCPPVIHHPTPGSRRVPSPIGERCEPVPPAPPRGHRPRTHRNARRNQSVRRSVSADASTCDSVPPYPGP